MESWWNWAWQLLCAQTKREWKTQLKTDFYLMCLALDAVVFDSMSLYLTLSLSLSLSLFLSVHFNISWHTSCLHVRIWLPWLSIQHLCIASSRLLSSRWAASLLLKHHHQLRYKVLVQARAWGAHAVDTAISQWFVPCKLEDFFRNSFDRPFKQKTTSNDISSCANRSDFQMLN